MAKEVAAFIKLQIKGGAANPSPPVGPALGSKGVNIMDFCNSSTRAPRIRRVRFFQSSLQFIQISRLTLLLNSHQ